MSSLTNHSSEEEEAWSIPLVEPTVPPPMRRAEDGTTCTSAGDETTHTAHRPTTSETKCRDSPNRVTATDHRIATTTTTTTTTTSGRTTWNHSSVTRPSGSHSPVALSLVVAEEDVVVACQNVTNDEGNDYYRRHKERNMIRLPAALGRRELLRLCWASSSSSSSTHHSTKRQRTRKHDLSEAAKYLSRHNMMRMDAHNWLHIRNSGTNAHAIHLNGQSIRHYSNHAHHHPHDPILIHSGDLLSIVISPLHITLSFRFITTPTTTTTTTTTTPSNTRYNNKNDTMMAQEQHESTCSDKDNHQMADTTSRVSIDTGMTTLPAITRTINPDDDLSRIKNHHAHDRPTQERNRPRTTTFLFDKEQEQQRMLTDHNMNTTTPTRTTTNVAVASNPHEEDCEEDDDGDGGGGGAIIQEKYLPPTRLLASSEGSSPLLSMHHFSNPNHDDDDNDDVMHPPGSHSICAGEEEEEEEAGLLLTCQDVTMWALPPDSSQHPIATNANKRAPSHPLIPVTCLHRSQLIHHLQQQQQQQQKTSSFMTVSHESKFRDALLSILTTRPQHETETSSDNIIPMSERPLPALLQGTLLHRS